ncbi:RloB family protein [Absicoccus intestinalis]|uniref:RloB family protein n=1 Tax=Absicoccus intestinalis TaxID=2926319 RepID=A0ABU4WLZ0_9FIRM|nr:RloB family protein [Absicoccus sp. CLA-KB-P134]MDX8416429.1 RloB family protein [Absicoccus sp. CLA-KB-P134]
MAKKDRTGKRKRRSHRSPEMGYYLVVTDTKATEENYFRGLRNSLPNDLKDQLVIKVVKTETKSLLDKCLEQWQLTPQYCNPWIIFDRDLVPNFDQIIYKAQRMGIHVGWSNPCFEIWMFGYFGNIPNIMRSKGCCTKFSELYKKKTGQEYKKSDETIYHKLIQFGDEELALEQAKIKYHQCDKSGEKVPSEMWPCTTVNELVYEIVEKRDKKRI